MERPPLSTSMDLPQEAFLFSATLAENIALARSDATRTEAVEMGR